MTKEHTLTCSAGSEALPSPHGGPDSERSPSASANPTPSGCCESTGQTCRSMMTCEPSQATATQGQLFSREDFPASLSVSPGSEQARKMTASSGLQWLPLLKLSGPLGSLARMCLASSRWNSTVVLLTWKHKATPSGRSLFQLAPSAPSTDATECGLWPTARSRDWKGQTQRGQHAPKDGLPNAVAMWPTPRAGKVTDEEPEAWQARKDAGKVATPPLTLAVKMYPTPDAGAAKGRGASSAENRTRLGGSLNPTWVEWLQGYPLGWTDCGDSETQSCRKSRRRS